MNKIKESKTKAFNVLSCIAVLILIGCGDSVKGLDSRSL